MSTPLDTPDYYLQRMRSQRPVHRIHVFVGHAQAILADSTLPADTAVSRLRLCLDALTATEHEPDYGADLSPTRRLIPDGFTEELGIRA